MRRLLVTFTLFASFLLSGCGSAVTVATVATVAGPQMDVLTLSYNGQALTLELPASPTPTTYGSGYNFTVSGMAVFADGSTCADGLEFYTNPVGGGGFADSCIAGLAPYIGQGTQLFSGSVTEPTFIPGTYNFNAAGLPGVLTIAKKITVASTPTSGS